MITKAAPIVESFYADNSDINSLKNKNDRESLEKAARIFSSIFISMMLKSRRKMEEAFKSDLFNSKELELYNEIHDNQLAVHLSNSDEFFIGKQIVSQYEKNMPTKAADAEYNLKNITRLQRNNIITRAQPKLAKQTVQTGKAVNLIEDNNIADSAMNFVRSIWGSIQEAAKALNQDPKILLSQAVLETGWGKAMPADLNGKKSNNIFGIKANETWTGTAVKAKTMEFIDGDFKKRTESFRGYDRISDSVKDYVSLIKNSPRFKDAIKARTPEEYIRALKLSGYATDPLYEEKVMRIFKSDTLKQALSQLALGDKI